MAHLGILVRQLGLVALVSAALGCEPQLGQVPTPIPETHAAEASVPPYQGRAATAHPLGGEPVPQHPFMGPNGQSCMHADAYSSNTHPQAGPLGRSPAVRSAALGMVGGECASIQYERLGRAVSVCVKARRPILVLLDPATLEILDSLELPLRHSSLLHLREMMDDTSGGSYFYIDRENRAVIGTAGGAIEIISILPPHRGAHSLERAVEIDLSEQLALAYGEDRITSVMPDWQGRLWFAGRFGTVGTVAADGTGAKAMRLSGEQIENSFSVAQDGVYIVSDHALYRFAATPDGTPTVLWRETYDRGIGRKVGQINQGSGTTPTLLGSEFVAIADNAEPRMNVLVYRRGEVSGSRRVCAVPVFEPGASATENGLIGHGRSLIVENNAGYDIFRTMEGGRTSAGGVSRIDVDDDGAGCHLVWTSHEISQTTVPKLSTATGLVYLYTKRPHTADRVDAYYLTAVDFRTGETLYRVLTGVGEGYDNNWGAISLSPRGSAFVGVLNGFLEVLDGSGDEAPPPDAPHG